MKKLLLWGSMALLWACTPDDAPLPESVQAETPQITQESTPKGVQMRVSSSSRLSNHFQNWLSANGYGSDDFANGPSYGGRSSSSDPVNQQPVIFIHGNSDDATGWDESIDYFRNNGYRTSELYAITWGPADASQAANQYHSYAYLTRVRRFIQAVKAYTGASKVDVIGHSMGVTLGRKAIKGGTAYDAAVGGNYNLGSRLSFVDTFVGIAGGNRGLTACYYASGSATCSDRNGFYPGYIYWGTGPYNVSDLLTGLNNDPNKEGSYVYSIWSTADQIIGYGCIVYGQNTCRIPGQNGERAFYSAPYGHFGVKDLTGYYQLRMVRDHQTN
ncbi:MAG: alpha/beta fold hydrolase [Bacteroidota bacterium]